MHARIIDQPIPVAINGDKKTAWRTSISSRM